MRSSNISNRRVRRDRVARRRMTLVGIATILSLLVSLFPQVVGIPAPTASAHNLQTRMVSMFLDPATQALLDGRMAAPGWTPPDPLLQEGDELGLIIKVVPRDGTTTGVGGHVDFYVPGGVDVIDVGYMVPDGTAGFTKVAMKGQSPIAIGDGPIGAKATTQLIDATGWTGYTNINGVTQAPVVPASGLHRGTIAGVYGDTGIFYATDSDTAYGSWQAFTGDSTANGCGSLAYHPTVLGKTLVNNSGDTVVPCNKWDAEQLMAWGAKGGTYGVAAPIVDYGDGRGNAPWGFASGVAGPQSGYAWYFDWDQWNSSAKTAADMRAAMANTKVGPWNRIKYPGSRVSYDQPGTISTVLGYASVDASNVGYAVSSSTPLPSNTKTIRWAVGQLTAYRPEYVWVKIRLNSITEITDPSGCPVFKGDTFGGDAGGTDNGKDHLWRYYEPTEVRWNGCLAAQKPATREFVKVGDTYQYKLKVYNLQAFTLSAVVARDTLPSGVTFISAFPSQSSGPNPLVWNVGTLLPGQKWEATVTVKASGTGYLDNVLTIDSAQLPTQTILETTESGAIVYLVPSKSVTPTSVAPGGAVTYDILVKNIGTGPTGNPVTIRDFLPGGLTFDGTFAPVVYVNGALVTPTVNTSDPTNPIITVPAAINGGSQMTIKFKATVPTNADPGVYCNSYSVTQNAVPITTGSEGCITVGGGKIGDTIFRDWNGNGTQDAGEEGMPGVTVTLTGPGCPSGCTATTDANGNYLFSGLTEGTYTVTVPSPGSGGVPSGFSVTADPDGAPYTTTYAKALAADEIYLGADWGYKPGGTGSIGDKVFEDIGNDGYFDSGADFGIPNVTVWLYEDTDGDGVITAGVDALVATTQSDASGNYLFSNLAGDPYDYIVKVDKTDADIQAYFDAQYGSGTSYQISTPEVSPSPNLAGSDLDNDFGFWRAQPGSIGDQVFIDNNANGVYDAGDAVLPNATVSLYQDTNGNGVLDAGEPLLQTTSTDVDGQYTFGSLGPGKYIVDVDQNDPDLPGGLTATRDPIAATLTAGQNKDDVDFPFVSVLTKSVDKAVANPGDTLTFTINPYYPGPSLLSSVVVQDTVPYGTAFLSAGQGGELSPYTPQPATQGQVTTLTTGQGIYSINSNTPQYRTWDGSTFGAQTASVALGDTPNILIGAASSTRNEKIVVDIIANNPEVQAMRWNGTAWAALPIPPSTTTAGALSNLASNIRDRWGGAVAYEQLSGDAMLVWNNTTVAGTNRLTWNVWNGSAWSTNTDVSTTGEPRQMRLAARPNSDEMILVTSNDTAYDYARVWDGSAWSTAQILENASGGSNTAIGVAYEQQSGDALVVYGKAVATDVKLYYRTYSGGVWSAEQSLDPTALGVTTGPQWVSIAADPNDDDIAVGVVTSGGKTWLAAWDGSAWGDPELATETAATTAALNVAVGFETLSGLAGAAYGVAGATTVAFRTWTPETGWSEEATGPDIGATPNAIAVSPSPNSDRLILSTNDSNSDAQYTLWDGDAWGAPLVASAATGGTANQPVLFLWDRQQPPSSTTNLTAGPTTVLDGGAITVQMTLRATKRVTGVTPGALTAANLTGNTATVACGSPTPASQTVPANVPTTFTWSCTASSAATAAEFSFSAGASGAYAGVPGGSYTFTSGTSNSVNLLPLGDRGTVTWDLGANTAAEDGVGADPGAALCPVTVTLYPTADTYIDSGNATNWFGAATTVVTRPAKKYALFKFDISSLAGKTIQSAVFGAYVNAVKSVSNHYDQIYRLKTAWTEGTGAANGATWNDPNGTGTAGVWASTGGKFGASDYDGTTLYGVIGPEIQNFYEYGDVTALVKDWTKSVAPVANNGLALISAGTDGNDGKYNAREASSTTTDPVLVVTYLQSTAGGCGTVNTTLTSLADTYVDKKNPAVNYGQVTTIWTQPADANNLEHSLLWFDLGQIPPGATINSATLSVNVATARATNHVDKVHVMTRPWYEATASWNDNDAIGAGDWAAGTFGSGDYNAASLGTITPSTTGVKTLSVISAVNDWVNNGVTNRGFALISTGTDTSDAKYRSREDGTAGNRPTLTVNWTLVGNPGPSTLVSFSAAPMLTTPGAIKVTMTASSTSAGTITAVTAPSPLGVAGENGVSATCGSATLVSADATISSTSDPVVYEWTCTATAGAVPGSVTFSGKPTGTGGVFNTAKSNSVLVTPPLTYQATVNTPAVVDVVRNTATIQAKEPDVQLTPDVCYAIADSIDNAASDNDILVTWNRSTGAFADVGTGTGTTHAEAAAWNLAQTVLYTTNRDATVAAGSDRFGTINATTGVYTPIGRLVSTANPLEGALGNFTVLDVDGMSFDPITGKLYAVHRREDSTNGNTLLDVLFQINPVTGFHIEDAYGAGVDYVVLRTDLLPTPLYDVDDIAFDPLTGELFAIANDSTTGVGDKDRLVKINKATGALTDIGRITNAAGGAGVDDMEGLSFLGDGRLDGTTGNTPGTPNDNSLWRIDTTTAVATKISAFPSHGDYEALACKNGQVQPGEAVIPPTASNTTETALTASIGDYVWNDLDGDGVQDAGELPLAGVQVCATNGSVTLCETTDGNGLYRIFGLAAGAWTVNLDLGTTPAGYQPTTPTSLSVTLAANEQYSNADFGLRPPGTASIGDTVWLDANANGAVDAGESGLPFVTVELYKDTNNNGVIDAGDVLFGATTTDADGKYLFSGLYGGDYLVAVDTASPVTSPYGGEYTIASALTQVFGANPRDVTLSDGQAVTTADFGYNWGGIIGDYVWWDTNTNGAQDESPATPIAGAAVLLYFDANNNGILDPAEGDYQVGYTSTDANGLYHFYNLPPGPYLVDVYEDSFNPVPGVRATVPTTPNVQYVNLGPKQTYLDADFGYYVGAKVEGNVFWDADRNGIFDGGETGLTPVTVTLTGIDMLGNPVTATTTTDAAGHFNFVVPEGNYTLSYNSTQTTGLGYPDATTPLTYDFHAYPGEDWHPVFDFGVDHSGVIGDTVWNDLNGNGVQDAGEPGLAGVTIQLWDSTHTTLLAVTATDSQGSYLFPGLPDGTYQVDPDESTLPADFALTTANDPDTATVTGGGSDLNSDFGYRYSPPAGVSVYSILGYVWGDTNGNGVYDPGLGELPLMGVKVTFDCGDYGTYVVTTASQPGGNYSLSNVPGDPGSTTCTIIVDPATLPSAAYTQTGDPDSVCPGAGCNDQTTVTVTNSNITDRNFGYREILGSISGTVCSATDGDGLCQPGEPGLTPVTVTLIYAGPDGILGTTDDVTTPTTTDASGNYTFPGLAPGLYQVVETNPANYTSLADRDGGNPDNISLALARGQNAVDQDFEDTQVSAGFIGDLVWWDIDKDGQQDAGEPGIPGVTVELLQNNAVIATTTTDANGLYGFTNLADGAYVVRIQGAEFSAGGTLEIWTASPQNAGSVPDNLDSDGDPATHDVAVTLTGGAGTADTDFGFHVSASYQVSKKLTSLNPARLGQEVTFSITITNTGATWISVLPLQDTYDTTYLTYSFSTHFATPDTNDHVNDGVLNWSDLTGAPPKGFGVDLAPGVTKVVQISFTARSDTSGLPGRQVVNTVTVANAMADPDGPSGPLGALAPLPVQQASAGVQILTPTGITFEEFGAVAGDAGVLVNWRTASEAEILGFNVLRATDGGEFTLVNPELILAEFAGLEQGAAYTFRDEGLPPGAYTYRLEVIKLDGSTEPYGAVDVTVQ